jgi:hypothetical protein
MHHHTIADDVDGIPVHGMNMAGCGMNMVRQGTVHGATAGWVVVRRMQHHAGADDVDGVPVHGMNMDARGVGMA